MIQIYNGFLALPQVEISNDSSWIQTRENRLAAKPHIMRVFLTVATVKNQENDNDVFIHAQSSQLNITQ